MHRVRHRCHHKSAAPPWAHTIDTGEDAVCRPQIQTPSHKVVTVVTIVEVNRTTPD